MSEHLSTKPYKGVRDFYPEDMAVQQYLFETWSYTAEQFGFLRYEASVLEPSELYKAKGAENEEMVNEQTYTFTDRGKREVTLRPEMTPTVARMVAGRRNELSFPVRWYSIPNLFRYERTQRGRLREHWQLNCDIFGVDDVSADIEILLLADAIFRNFGAENGTHYTINVASRALLESLYDQLTMSDEERVAATRLADRKLKMKPATFKKELFAAIADEDAAKTVLTYLNADSISTLPATVLNCEPLADLTSLMNTLDEAGSPVVFDPTIVRGFDYYTGIVFEVKDLHPENNRSMMGGGRYNDLTGLFGGDPIPGIGFGFGDVTLKDFLESHNLLTADVRSATLSILPMDTTLNINAQKIAQQFRLKDIATTVDVSTKKVGKKISAASDAFIDYVLVLGSDELDSGTYTVKNLATGEEESGTVEELIASLVE